MNRNRFTGGIFVFLGACSFGLLSTIVKFAYAEGYTLGQVTGSQTFLGMTMLWLLYYLQKNIGRKRKPAYHNENVNASSAGDIESVDDIQHPSTNGNNSSMRSAGGAKTDLPHAAEQNNSTKQTAWWKVSIAGIFTGLVGIFYYQSVKLLPASIAIILLMQYLWISILIEAVLFKKKPHKMQLIAAAIVLVGTLFAGGILNESITLNIKGLGFGMLAAFCYAIFLIASGRVGNDLPVLRKSALMITGSCIATWIIFPPLFFFDGIFFGGLYKWGLMLALLGTVIPPFFFSFGMPRTGVSLGAILSAAELPVAVISSRFILKESVEALQWFGVILILSAIVLTNIKFKRAPSASG